MHKRAGCQFGLKRLFELKVVTEGEEDLVQVVNLQSLAVQISRHLQGSQPYLSNLAQQGYIYKKEEEERIQDFNINRLAISCDKSRK